MINNNCIIQVTMKQLIITLLLLWAIPVMGMNHDVGYLYDSRDYVTCEIISYGEVAGLNLWGFTDFYNEQRSKKPIKLSNYFMEYRLSYNLTEIGERFFQQNSFELEAEYNGMTGNGNDLMRYGFVYTRNFFSGGFVKLRWHPLDSRSEYHKQYSLIHSIPLNKYLSFDGFYDYNVIADKSYVWVYEPSLVYNCFEPWSFTFIYRFDGYVKDKDGIAVGVFYKF